MRTDLFDFDLPESAIALEPASPRDAARLLVVRPASLPLPACGERAGVRGGNNRRSKRPPLTPGSSRGKL